MDLRADERALYEGRPSWRALMTFYLGGIGLAAAVVVVLGILFDDMGTAIAIAVVIVALTLLIGFVRRVGHEVPADDPAPANQPGDQSGRTCRRRGSTGSRT